jgi:hypothetical protein
VSWYDDSDDPSGPPTERLPSAFGPGFPDTRPIRSHRLVKPRSRRRRWLVLALVVLVLAVGGLLTHGTLAGGRSASDQSPGPRATRAQAQYGLEVPSLPPRSSAPASVTPSPTPSPSPTRSEPSPALPAPTPPSATTTAKTTTANTTTANTTSIAPPFAAFTLEAEQGTLVGGATALACATCSGGWRVGYIGTPAAVVLTTTLAQAGTRTIRVTYETDGPRELKTKVNGALVDVRWVNGTGWESPMTFQFSASVPAGPLEIRFYNDTSPAPDIDAVTIS